MRFTIRDVLWLMVVVALLTAWWLDRSRLLGHMRRHAPLLYEVITGEEIDSNNAFDARSR
jgi:hypothetical protein